MTTDEVVQLTYAETDRREQDPGGNRRKSAADTAYLHLRDLVVTGILPPGAVLNEQELVDRLGIGRTPVREAIQRLAAQHVVTIFPRRGVAVAKLGMSDVQAIFEAREAVEAKLASLAARRRSDEQAATIFRIGAEVKEAMLSDDFRRFLDRDQELHHAIAEAARSRFLAESADYLLMLSDWVWHQYFMLRGSHPSDYFNHDHIIKAIMDRDSDEAFRAMEIHVRKSHDLVRSVT